MRTRLVILLALVLTPAGLGKDDRGKSDRQRLQGTWRIVRMETEGKPLPAEAVKGAELIFEGDHYALKGARENFRGRFRLHPDRKPRAIDTTFVEVGGKEKGKAVGIYKLEGDRLTICWRQGEDRDRPKEFRTRPGSGRRLVVAQRVKP